MLMMMMMMMHRSYIPDRLDWTLAVDGIVDWSEILQYLERIFNIYMTELDHRPRLKNLQRILDSKILDKFTKRELVSDFRLSQIPQIWQHCFRPATNKPLPTVNELHLEQSNTNRA